MWPAEVFGLDMIYSEQHSGFAAILADELIAPEYFAAA
jgi:hypothetical protein